VPRHGVIPEFLRAVKNIRDLANRKTYNFTTISISPAKDYNIDERTCTMKFESIVFPLDKDFKNFERQVGEQTALRAEVELLRSILMEDGKRDLIKAGEKAMYKRLLQNK
jgi:hypothetical protein